MDFKKILPWLAVSALVFAGYFFKDKLFSSSGGVASVPVYESALIKTNITIEGVNGGRVDYKVTFEAKKDLEMTALRAFYFDKTKRKEYSGVGNSKRTRLDSDELGTIDLADGKVTLKAGEKTDVAGHFEIDQIRESHYIEVTGNVSTACPESMEVLDCIEMQRKESEKDPKGTKIYMIQRILEKEKK